MNAKESNAISKVFEVCPDCGNGLIGNGQGKLNIDTDLFLRSCKCGFEAKLVIKHKKLKEEQR